MEGPVSAEIEALKRKRTYTLVTFARDFLNILLHIPDLRTAARAGRVSKAFAKKIMLAVTQVNGCRICNYGHTRMALEAGVPPEEIRRIIAADLGDFPEDETPALLFAQHYAESEGRVDPEAWYCLVDYYGEATARDILAYIRMITLGNLLGNTYDAFYYRLTGRLPTGKMFGDPLADVEQPGSRQEA